MGDKRKKGFFSRVNLPVANAYMLPAKRNKILLAGAMLVLVFALIVALDFARMKGRFLSNGPLTGAHAAGTRKCEDCHTAFAGTPSEKCSSCHVGPNHELGVYSYAAHYLYHSADFRRDIPSPKEKSCATCHNEHLGKNQDLKAVANERCLSCHAAHEFNQHPAFAAVAKEEEAPLKFPHVAHVRELWKSETQLEDICLRCHVPEPDGKHFQPLSFDRDCDSCHLTTSVSTPRLALESDAKPGVLSLESIQARDGLGDRWSFYTSAAAFRSVGNSFVSKTTIHHRDPWILANLRHLRQKLYPDAGLADLVDAGVPAADSRSSYAEAVSTLRSYVRDLRSRPEPQVQAELTRVEAQLEAVEARLADPYASLDETPFLLPFEKAVTMDVERRAAIEDLAAQLSKPCTNCHQMQDLTIVKVDKDQRSLGRARFDHRAHVIGRQCIDCHQKFPDGSLVKGAPSGLEMPASVQNIPDIDSCRQCHNQQGATTDCVSCHDFHPDQSRRAFLHSHLEVSQ